MGGGRKEERKRGKERKKERRKTEQSTHLAVDFAVCVCETLMEYMENLRPLKPCGTFLGKEAWTI